MQYQFQFHTLIVHELFELNNPPIPPYLLTPNMWTLEVTLYSCNKNLAYMSSQFIIRTTIFCQIQKIQDWWLSSFFKFKSHCYRHFKCFRRTFPHTHTNIYIYMCYKTSVLFIASLATSYKNHNNDVIMGVMASQITSLTSVCSTVYSGVDQRKHQSSASLAFVWGPQFTGDRWIPRTNGQ